jgi:hypothetical protein
MAQLISDVGSATVIRSPYLDWGPVLGGAIGAAALSFVFLTFGGAIGLSITSPWPNSGASIATVAIVVGLWMAIVQVASFAAGGYLAGRLRASWADTTLVEHQFRDGAHGFMVWATGVVLGAIILGMTGAGALSTLAQSRSLMAAGAAFGAAAKGIEGLATSPADYAVDLLLRPAGNVRQTQPAPNVDGLRMEAGRIFTSAINNRAFTARDRDYLTQIVVARTGLSEVEAQRRVDAAVTEARDLEIKARDTADKARKAALIAGFIAAATLLISLAAACAGASLGGRHRDENKAPEFLGYRFW